MITLKPNNNTILLYNNLVTGSFPEQVEVILTNKEDKRVVTFTCNVVIDGHISLISLSEDISRNKGQNTLVIKDPESDQVYYKEISKVK